MCTMAGNPCRAPSHAPPIVPLAMMKPSEALSPTLMPLITASICNVRGSRCPTAMLIRQVGAREPRTKLQIAFARRREKQSAKRRVAFGVMSHPCIASNDGLDTARARRFVEFDEPELVGEIGQRERRHCIGDGGLHSFIDADRAVRNRKFAMKT